MSARGSAPARKTVGTGGAASGLGKAKHTASRFIIEESHGLCGLVTGSSTPAIFDCGVAEAGFIHIGRCEPGTPGCTVADA